MKLKYLFDKFNETWSTNNITAVTLKSTMLL